MAAATLAFTVKSGVLAALNTTVPLVMLKGETGRRLAMDTREADDEDDEDDEAEAGGV